MGTGQQIERDSSWPQGQPWDTSTEQVGNKRRGVLSPLCQELDVWEAEGEWAAWLECWWEAGPSQGLDMLQPQV